MVMGIERTTFIIGPDGKIAKIFPKVRVDGHVEEVLSALQTSRWVKSKSSRKFSRNLLIMLKLPRLQGSATARMEFALADLQNMRYFIDIISPST